MNKIQGSICDAFPDTSSSGQGIRAIPCISDGKTSGPRRNALPGPTGGRTIREVAS